MNIVAGQRIIGESELSTKNMIASVTKKTEENKIGIPLCRARNGSEMLVESPGRQYSSFSIIIECGNKIRKKNFTDENAVFKKRFILSFQLKFPGVVSFLFQRRL